MEPLNFNLLSRPREKNMSSSHRFPLIPTGENKYTLNQMEVKGEGTHFLDCCFLRGRDSVWEVAKIDPLVLSMGFHDV